MTIRQLIQKNNISEKLKNKQFVIYPYGKAGKEIKKILNEDFGLTELAVLDSNADCIENVRALNYLDSIDVNNTYIIIASYDLLIYDEIRNFVKSVFPTENIIDLFSPVNTLVDPRRESLRLCAGILNENNIKGDVAEAGVYEGNFAKYINLFFKNRYFYLFDTFEGFTSEKLKQNCDERWTQWMNENHTFVSSGMEVVRSRMPYPEKCIFKKGYFPDSAEGIDTNFAFVSLDMDIYQSTKDGLDYFWPRMEKRGVIFIHDYVSWNCPGVKQAVDEFCENNNVGVISLSDECGSAVLIK